MDIKIFCDFDGTITKNDISVAILRKFAQWDNQERTILRGNIGSKSAYSSVAKYISASLDEMKKFARDVAEIQDGFIDFFKFISSNNFGFFVVSDGFGFYIREILNGYNIKIFASELLDYNGRFHFVFPNSSDFCELCATCKLKILRKMGGKNFKVFIGNGISDRCAVEEADIVFAKSKLEDICYMKGISFFPFENFYDIISVFQLKPRCFVIDFDGTLGWSYDGILDAFTFTFKKIKKKIPDKESLVKLVGLPLEECFRKVLGNEDEDLIRESVSIFRQRYKKVFLKKTYIAPGAKRTIDHLKNLGYKVVILSNKRDYFLKRLVENFKLNVDMVIGEGDIVEDGKIIKKPDPRTIDFISEKLNLNKNEIFVVGDTEIDLFTAKESSFIALYSQYSPPSYFKERGKVLSFISCISDLEKIGLFYKLVNS